MAFTRIVAFGKRQISKLARHESNSSSLQPSLCSRSTRLEISEEVSTFSAPCSSHRQTSTLRQSDLQSVAHNIDSQSPPSSTSRQAKRQKRENSSLVSKPYHPPASLSAGQKSTPSPHTLLQQSADTISSHYYASPIYSTTNSSQSSQPSSTSSANSLANINCILQTSQPSPTLIKATPINEISPGEFEAPNFPTFPPSLAPSDEFEIPPPALALEDLDGCAAMERYHISVVATKGCEGFLVGHASKFAAAYADLGLECCLVLSGVDGGSC